MKKLLFFLFVIVFSYNATAMSAIDRDLRPVSVGTCGAGYILVSHDKIDGISASECQKLWCMDLETGRMMGKGKSPANGYRATNAPTQLCDAQNNCIECFGERRWCNGDVPGQWNPEYGAYTRGGDNATYQSYQKGGCFSWHLEKPNCPEGEAAVLQNGKWICAIPTGSAVGSRASSVRRTGTLRRGLH